MSKTAKRILIIVATVTAGVLVGLYIAIEHVLPYAVITPYRITRADLVKVMHGEPLPQALGLRGERLNITVEDSITMKGWFIHADSARPLGTVIILHGISSCKEAMLPMARALARGGFNSIVYDSRGHGESGGQFCTFGYYEKHDLSRFIDSALARFGADTTGEMAVMGNSLGAAVALQALEADGRLRCGVVESSFATLPEIVFDYMKRLSGIGWRRVSDRALARGGEIARFPADSIRPEESARRVIQPVMVVHGLLDEHISAAYGKRVFDNLAGGGKEWVPVPQGSHYDLASKGGHAYKQRITGFLRKHCRVGSATGEHGRR